MKGLRHRSKRSQILCNTIVYTAVLLSSSYKIHTNNKNTNLRKNLCPVSANLHMETYVVVLSMTNGHGQNNNIDHAAQQYIICTTAVFVYFIYAMPQYIICVYAYSISSLNVTYLLPFFGSFCW